MGDRRIKHKIKLTGGHRDLSVINISTSYERAPDFQYLIAELQNPANALRGFAAYRRSQFQQSIASERDYDGSPTARLSDRYRIEKERQVGKRSIRVKTGKLVGSHRVYVQGDRLIEELSAPYAGYVQQKRPMIPFEALNAADQAKLLDLVLIGVQRALRR